MGLSLMNTNLEWFRVPEKIYFKKGALPVALRELKEVYSRKKAVVMTDSCDFRNNVIKPVTDILEELHIAYSVIPLEETEEAVLSGVDTVRKFEPDCMIAVGDTAVSVGKLIRILYENPELTFQELTKRVNLRDRTMSALKTGKVYFVAVAGSNSVGDEVTPFSMRIPETELGVQDYALLPDMSIIDIDLIQQEDVHEIAFMCMITLVNTAIVFSSEYTSDYAQGLAVHAVQLVLTYFPKYQKNLKDEFALERLANASEMSAMAFANVYGGEALPEDLDFSALASALGMDSESLESKFAEISEIAYYI